MIRSCSCGVFCLWRCHKLKGDPPTLLLRTLIGASKIKLSHWTNAHTRGQSELKCRFHHDTQSAVLLCHQPFHDCSLSSPLINKDPGIMFVPSKTPSVGASLCAILLSFLQQITTRIAVQRIVVSRNTPVVTPKIITYCFSGSPGVASTVVATHVGCSGDAVELG